MSQCKFRTPATSQAALLLLSGMCVTQSLHAAATAEGLPSGLEEVVVTANKRTERLVDVPVAASVVSADQVDRQGIAKIDKLGEVVPNLMVAPTGPGPTGTATFIRGIGQRGLDPTNDPPNALSVDGVYTGTVTAGLLDTFDIEAVEVLRGPQGTLQGRNAMGGAINMSTKRPRVDGQGLSTDAEVSYGRFGTWAAKLRAEAPLIEDKLAAKFAIMSTDSDGYINGINGAPDKGGLKYTFGRLGLFYKPNDSFDLYATADVTRDRTLSGRNVPANSTEDFPRTETLPQVVPVICAAFGQCTPYPHYTHSSDFIPENESDVEGYSLIANWNFGPATFTSVSGYRHVDDLLNSDVDATNIGMLHVGPRNILLKETNQEFRFTSNEGQGWDFDGRVNWVAGLNYFRQSFHLLQVNALPALGVNAGDATNPPFDYSQVIDSYAAFAHADWDITDKWQIFGGVRHQKDEKSFVGINPAVGHLDATFSDTIFEGGVRYRPTENSQTYIRWAQGNRPGGFTTAGGKFEPEELNSYEIGLKLDGFGHRLAMNTAAFYYDYKNLQRDVTVAIPDPPFHQETIKNAADSTIWGAEIEVMALPLDSLTLTTFVGYLNAEYKGYFDTNPGTGQVVDNSNLRMPYTPHWTTGASAQYTMDVGGRESFLETVVLGIDGNYTSKQNTTVTDIPLADQAGYSVFNASVRLNGPSERYFVMFTVDNLTDKYYIINAEPAAGLTSFVVEGMPRTYGVRFGMHFGQ